MDLRDPEAFRALYENNAKKLYNLALRSWGTATGPRSPPGHLPPRLRPGRDLREGPASPPGSTASAPTSPTTTSAPSATRRRLARDRVATDEGSSAELADRSRPVEDPGDEAGQEEVRAAVRGILDGLPERERTVLILRHYEA